MGFSVIQVTIEREGKRELIEIQELNEEASIRVRSFNKDLLIIKDESGEVHAIENYCPHAIQALTDAEIFGSMIKCRKHGAIFNLGDGSCVGSESIGRLKKYSVSIIDGMIIIKL